MILALASAGAATAQNWPGFRGERAKGVAAEPAPLRWDAASSQNVLWKARIPGMAHASPVIWDDRVFVVTVIAPAGAERVPMNQWGADAARHLVPHTWKMLALNRRNGKTLWEHTAHHGVPRIKRHVKASHASATPVTDGQSLVALMGSEGLFCYTLDGNLKWKVDPGVFDVGPRGDPSYEVGSASSPVIYKNLVIVQNDHRKDSHITAYDLQSGKQVWRTASRGWSSWATPTLVRAREKDVLVVNSPLDIRAFDPESGRELWKLSRTAEVLVPTPVEAGDVVIVTGGHPGNTHPIYAIRKDASGDAGQGKGLVWSRQNGSSFTTTPLVHGGQLYVLQDNGVLAAYDAATGDEIYRERVAPVSFSASPVAAGNLIYLASEDGEVYVVRAGPRYELLAVNRMPEGCFATPAVVRGTIFVRTTGHLYAIGAEKAAGAEGLDSIASRRVRRQAAVAGWVKDAS